MPRRGLLGWLLARRDLPLVRGLVPVMGTMGRPGMEIRDVIELDPTPRRATREEALAEGYRLFGTREEAEAWALAKERARLLRDAILDLTHAAEPYYLSAADRELWQEPPSRPAFLADLAAVLATFGPFSHEELLPLAEALVRRLRAA
jgi:hypothetical protein